MSPACPGETEGPWFTSLRLSGQVLIPLTTTGPDALSPRQTAPPSAPSSAEKKPDEKARTAQHQRWVFRERAQPYIAWLCGMRGDVLTYGG